MADYVLTYDIPNEDREVIEHAITEGLKAKRERGVSTFWKFQSNRSPHGR